MKNTPKIAIVGSLLLGASLLLGGCTSTDNAKSPTIYKQGSTSYTTDDLLKDYQAAYGSTNLQTTIAYKIVNDTYKITDKDVEAKYKSVAEDNGGTANLEEMIAENDMSVEGYKAKLKDDLALDKALIDLNGVTENKMKKKYKEVKNVRHALEVAVKASTDKKTLAAVKKAIEDGTSSAAILKKYSNSEEVYVNERDYTPDVQIEGLEGIPTMAKGDFKTLKTDDGTVFVRVESIKEKPYKELKAAIKSQLMTSKYKDLNDVYKKISEDKGLKFNEDYKDFSVVNTTATN